MQFCTHRLMLYSKLIIQYSRNTCTIFSWVFAGSGTLYIVETGLGGLVPQTIFDWNDGLYDVTWAENNENVLITGAGDGHVVMWDINQKRVHFKLS